MTMLVGLTLWEMISDSRSACEFEDSAYMILRSYLWLCTEVMGRSDGPSVYSGQGPFEVVIEDRESVRMAASLSSLQGRVV